MAWVVQWSPVPVAGVVGSWLHPPSIARALAGVLSPPSRHSRTDVNFMSDKGRRIG